MSEIDPKVIKKTQDSLGRLIKKPPLTDKLLSRPPFRFIHDICASLIKSTGLMKGLFSAEELNADNLRDKEAKTAFLKKVIDFVTAANNRAPNVRISSIISGKEADRTNALFQQLAEAANGGIDNADCVNKVLGVKQESKELAKRDLEKKEQKKDPLTSRESVKRSSGVESRKKSLVSSRSKDRYDKKKDRHENPGKKTSSKLPKTLEVERDPIKEPTTNAEKGAENLPTIQVAASEVSMPMSGQIAQAGADCNEDITKPLTAKGHEKSIESLEDEQQPGRAATSPKLSPGHNSVKTITPDPPTLIDNTTYELSTRGHKSSAQERLEAVETGHNDTKAAAATVGGILVENETLSEDDDANEDQVTASKAPVLGLSGVEAVAAERCGTDDAPGLRPAHTSGGEGDCSDLEEGAPSSGCLVNKLLKSRKELSGESTKTSNVLVVNDAATKREREATEREMERLCQVLQDLTRSALPLGKLIDFMQEDFESIQGEYREWKNEDDGRQQELKEAEGQIDPRVAELTEELAKLKKKHMEYRQAILSAKASIIKNDEVIQRMLAQASEAS